MYETAYWRSGEWRPPKKVEALSGLEHARYLQGWGRPGNTAVLAEDLDRGRLGAAWYGLVASEVAARAERC